MQKKWNKNFIFAQFIKELGLGIDFFNMHHFASFLLITNYRPSWQEHIIWVFTFQLAVTRQIDSILVTITSFQISLNIIEKILSVFEYSYRSQSSCSLLFCKLTHGIIDIKQIPSGIFIDVSFDNLFAVPRVVKYKISTKQLIYLRMDDAEVKVDVPR